MPKESESTLKKELFGIGSCLVGAVTFISLIYTQSLSPAVTASLWASASLLSVSGVGLTARICYKHSCKKDVAVSPADLGHNYKVGVQKEHDYSVNKPNRSDNDLVSAANNQEEESQQEDAPHQTLHPSPESFVTSMKRSQSPASDDQEMPASSHLNCPANNCWVTMIDVADDSNSRSELKMEEEEEKEEELSGSNSESWSSSDGRSSHSEAAPSGSVRSASDVRITNIDDPDHSVQI